jgi:hypothetical protein
MITPMFSNAYGLKFTHTGKVIDRGKGDPEHLTDLMGCQKSVKMTVFWSPIIEGSVVF